MGILGTSAITTEAFALHLAHDFVPVAVATLSPTGTAVSVPSAADACLVSAQLLRFSSDKLGIFPPFILVRSCYEQLYDFWSELSGTKIFAGTSPAAHMWGTPGIGKSVFLLYCADRALREGHTVALHHDQAPNVVFVLRPGGGVEEQDPNDPLDPGVWYLVDSVPKPVDRPWNPTLLVASSSYVGMMRMVTAVPSAAPQPLLMPVWSADEICLAAVASGRAPGSPEFEDVVSAYNWHGGVPRWVLIRSPDVAGIAVDDSLLRLDAPPDIWKLMSSVTEHPANNKLAQFAVPWNPADGKYDFRCRESFALASHRVTEQFIAKCQAPAQWEYLVSSIRSLTSPTEAALHRDFIEVYAHVRLMAGGTFEIQELSAEGEPSPAGILTVPPSSGPAQVIRRLEDLSGVSAGTYIKPSVSNFPVADAMLVPGDGRPVMLFQVTVGSRRGISFWGATKLVEAMAAHTSPAPEFHLYFVVCDLEGGPARAQPFVTAGSAPYRGPMGAIPSRFKQYRLHLPLTSESESTACLPVAAV